VNARDLEGSLRCAIADDFPNIAVFSQLLLYLAAKPWKREPRYIPSFSGVWQSYIRPPRRRRTLKLDEHGARLFLPQQL